jgi:hypothetical protein
VNFYHFYEQNILTNSVLKLEDNLILPLLVLTWVLNQVMIYSEGQVPCVNRLQEDNQWIAYGSSWVAWQLLKCSGLLVPYLPRLYFSPPTRVVVVFRTLKCTIMDSLQLRFVSQPGSMIGLKYCSENHFQDLLMRVCVCIRLIWRRSLLVQASCVC